MKGSIGVKLSLKIITYRPGYILEAIGTISLAAVGLVVILQRRMM